MNRATHPMRILLASFVLAVLAASPSTAQEHSSGTNSRKARDQAIASIPFGELTPQAQQKIQPVIGRPSIYRSLPTTTIDIDPDYYLFLIRQPEVVINIWQLMGVTEMQVDRTGPFSISTDDGSGTTGNVELIYGTNNLHVFYGEGEYKGALMPRKLRGKIVIVLRTEYGQGEAGQTRASSHMDIFVRIENATVGLIAKTLHPIIGTTADHNFTESIKFLQRLNDTTVSNGPGVQNMAHRLENLTPQVRQGFVQVAGLVFDRGQLRYQSAALHAPGNSDAPHAVRYDVPESDETMSMEERSHPARMAQHPFSNNTAVQHNSIRAGQGQTQFVQSAGNLASQNPFVSRTQSGSPWMGHPVPHSASQAGRTGIRQSFGDMSRR